MDNFHFEDLSKRFSNKIALQNISFDLDIGSTFCLIGRNGAGKTTLINILLGLIKADNGCITLDGDVNYLNTDYKRKFGVLVDSGNLIEEFDCISFLKFIGRIYQIDKTELQFRIEMLVSYFFENNFENTIIKNLSTGMKKKLGFCAAILHSPSILILDEPFSGLDPLSSKILVDFLIKFQDGKRMILLSSHDLGYIQECVSHVGVIDCGKMLFNGTIESFTNNGKINMLDAFINSLPPSDIKMDNLPWL
jgi:ABC-type multidrug transport system ATPase subunit